MLLEDLHCGVFIIAYCSFPDNDLGPGVSENWGHTSALSLTPHWQPGHPPPPPPLLPLPNGGDRTEPAVLPPGDSTMKP